MEVESTRRVHLGKAVPSRLLYQLRYEAKHRCKGINKEVLCYEGFMMEAELEQRLQASSKEQLVQLLRELIDRHPTLSVEMGGILESFTEKSEVSEESDEEITEDWDFSGEELTPVHALPQTLEDDQSHHQRLEEYAAHLRQQESSQGLAHNLSELIAEACACMQQNDIETGLDLYALMFDERLQERNSILTPVFDDMIDAAIPSLEEALISEFSGSAMFDMDTAGSTQVVASEARQRWLERLFALWLKRLDAHRVEEDLPEIMLDVAWNEDSLLLRSLAQNELQRQPRNEYANIVDFSRQYRTRALEKFLKILPRT